MSDGSDPYEKRYREAVSMGSDEEAVSMGDGSEALCKLPASIYYVKSPHVCQFVGRSSDIEKLLEAVQDEEIYCCSIYGQPGVGKSRVAIELAHVARARDRLEEWCILYISAVGLTSSAMLESSIHLALFQEKKLKSDSDLLTETRKLFNSNIPEIPKLLLIIDGCDRILANNQERQSFVTLLDSMVSAARRDFTIVTTSLSRYRLTYKDATDIRLDPLQEDDSVKLLQKCCSKCRNHLKDPEAKEVAAICGGLPVYLEAVRSILCKQEDILSPTELLQYMRGDPIKTLDEHRQYAKPSKAFENLFQVLPSDTKVAFWCLAVFPHSFSKKIGAYVCGMTIATFSATLTNLNDLALLHIQPNGEYTQHQLLREFALQAARKANCPKFAQCQQRFCQLIIERVDEAWNLFPRNPHRSVKLLDHTLLNTIHLLKILPCVVACSKSLICNYIKLATTYAPMLRLRIPAGIRMQFYKAMATRAADQKDNQNESYVKINLAQTMLEVYQASDALEQLETIQAQANVEDLSLEAKILFSVVHSQTMSAHNKGKEAIDDLDELVSKQITSVGLDGLRKQFVSNPTLTLIKIQLLLAWGDALFQQRYYMRAIEMYDMVTQLFESSVVHSISCTALIQMGRCYFYSRDYTNSCEKYKQALEMQKTLKCDELSLATTKYHIALTKAKTMKLEDLIEAKVQLTVVANTVSRFQRHHLRVLTSQALGKVHFMIGCQWWKGHTQVSVQECFKQSLDFFLSVLWLLHGQVQDGLAIFTEAFVFAEILRYILELEKWISDGDFERITAELNRYRHTVESSQHKGKVKRLTQLLTFVVGNRFAKKEFASAEVIDSVLPLEMSEQFDSSEMELELDYIQVITTESRQRADSKICDKSSTDDLDSETESRHGDVDFSFDDSLSKPRNVKASKTAGIRPASPQVEKVVLANLPKATSLGSREERKCLWSNDDDRTIHSQKPSVSYPLLKGYLT